MNRHMIFPLLLGVIGAGILISLGTWQVQRLAWKQGVLSEIAAIADGAPVTMADATSIEYPKYTPVKVSGHSTGQEIHILVSRKTLGAGYRIVSGFDLEGGGRIMLDRGFVRTEAKSVQRDGADLIVTGNVHQPDDRNSSTPPNDEAANIWFARDIVDMARVLDASPVLVVARSDTGQGIEPMPIGVSGIPNDHLQYAITWFSLAIVWLGMTAFLLWRIKRRTE